jgi:hypothetical protein
MLTDWNKFWSFFGIFSAIYKYNPNFSIWYILCCAIGAIVIGIILIMDVKLISEGLRF